MFYFQSIHEPEKKFVLLPGKEYIIGRRDCDIVIENDQSVSRKHAILKVDHPESNVQHPEKLPVLTLHDISKFGTHVNGERISGERGLQDGDEVRFGTPKSMHRIVYEPFIVTTSCLDSSGRKEVRALMCKMGGHVASEWQKDCSLLVMKNITVTVKVICALMSQKSIVTPAYLRAYYDHQKEGADERDPASFLPPVTENLINPDVSFLPDPQRCQVFLGTSFYFLCSKQFGKLNLAVELGGGVPILCEDPGSTSLEFLVEDKAVVMSAPSQPAQNSRQKEWIDKVVQHLCQHSKRPIQDAEIGYAVLHCSTEDFCNPHKDVSHLLSMPLASQSLSQVGGAASQMWTGMSQGFGDQQFKRPAGTVHAAASAGSEAKSARTPAVDTRVRHGQGGSSDCVSLPMSAADSSGRNSAGQRVASSLKDAIKEEPSNRFRPCPAIDADASDASASLSDIRRKSADAMQQQKRTRSRSHVSHNANQTSSRQTRSRSRSPAPEAVSLTETNQTSPQKRSAPSTTTSMFRPQSRSRSRSPVGKQVIVPDSETSPSFSAYVDEQRERAVELAKTEVKQEEVSPMKDRSARHAPSGSDSESLFDDEKTTENAAVKSEPAADINLIDGSDDEIVSSKAAPSKSKRKFKDSSSDDDSDDDDANPFDFLDKRPKKSARLGPGSSSHASGMPDRNKEPANELKGLEVEDTKSTTADTSLEKRLSLEPTRSKVGDSKSNTEDASSEKNHPKEPRSALHNGTSRDHSDIPIPRGFLSTRVPIGDQVEANAGFERENIGSATVQIQFDSLVVQRDRTARKGEDQSDVPAGMMTWNGKLVPNFKKFRKAAHVGAGRLPRIIGGRDLEEHCGKSRNEMDNWLHEMQRAESQSSRRDREALELFDYQPAFRSRNDNRR